MSDWPDFDDYDDVRDEYGHSVDPLDDDYNYYKHMEMSPLDDDYVREEYESERE